MRGVKTLFRRERGPDRPSVISGLDGLPETFPMCTDKSKRKQRSRAQPTVGCLRSSAVASLGASREKSADRSGPQGDCPDSRESPRLRALSTRLSCLCLSNSNSHKPAKLASSRSLFRLRSSFMGSESAGSRKSEQPGGSFVAIILCSSQPTKTQEKMVEL